LDALHHLYAVDHSESTLSRMGDVIESMEPNEKEDRGTLFHIGRYHFACSFPAVEKREHLRMAIENLTCSLEFPHVLAADDAIVRIVRGQAYVRLVLTLEDEGAPDSLDFLNGGIADLKFAFESSPSRFAKQTSLPSALQHRAEILARRKNYADARKDLEYASNPELVKADPVLASQAALRLMLVDLREALDRNDLAKIELVLPRVLEHLDCSRTGSLFAAIAARRLYQDRTASADPALLIRTIEMLKTVEPQLNQDALSFQMHLSVFARLQFLLAEVWDSTVLEQAVDTYKRAIDISTATSNPELVSQYGNCCLHLAKQLLRDNGDSERIAELLEEAAESLSAAAQAAESAGNVVSDSFQLVVTHSKAGEAYLRLCTFGGSEEAGRRAIESFERAIELGNTSPELLGLLGDAYYRIFQINRDHSLVQQVLKYKRMARDAGGESRENLSLSAKLAIIEWEDSGEKRCLSDAITWIAEAHEMSPSWPWPPFQIAELCDRIGTDAFRAALGTVSATRQHLRLVEIASSNERLLIELGCSLVLQNEEFGTKRLGGRQPVYVMEDPHRLLSGSYVFKETDERNATRDRDVIHAFSTFVRQHGIRGIRLPEPLGIFPQEQGRVVYVMRRARGHHLGRAVIAAKREGRESPVKDFQRALTILAAYHAWGLTVSTAPQAEVLSFTRAYIKSKLAMDPEVIPTNTVLVLARLASIPQVVKKNAHPENWLIDDSGNICMIDFESGRPLPILFEVAQLLEDYPLLPASREAWELRRELCQNYQDSFREFGGETISNDMVDEVYGLFVLLRSGFALQYYLRAPRSVPSSSALRARAEREAHHVEMLRWMAAEHPSAGVRELAKTFITELVGPQEA
jgi:tetratricopeptide (TPR) repeat protein